MKRRTINTVAVLAALLISFGVTRRAFAHPPHRAMADAASRFLASLSDEQRARAAFEWTNDKRTGWYFVPDKFIPDVGKRFGLPIQAMTPLQRLMAHGLLNTALSQDGYLQATTIMALEAILHELENKNPIRNPDFYYVSIFGSPTVKSTWAWRFEGHHLSVNVTLVDGKRISVTPSFFGSNPARVLGGKLEGVEVLRDEQQLARRLVRSLSEEQREAAIFDARAPRDILTSQDRKVDKGAFAKPRGIAFDALEKKQQRSLLRLVNVYARKYRNEIVKEIDGRSKIADGEGMYFAWAGGIKAGEGHYYRIQTPKFLFEYACTQNDANHVHAVWRDFDGDFGADLLGEHYAGRHADKDDGWIELFDGKSLAGWKNSENKSSFRVENGALVANGTRSHLFYKPDGGPFTDFELEAEIMTMEHSNSGIYIHSKFQERGWPKYGFEVQVNNTYHDPVKTGSLYHVANVLEAPAKDKEWFTMRVTVKGKHAVVTVNGKKVVDYAEPDDAKPGEQFTRVFDKGTFALQAHDPDSKVLYRRIRVRRLD